MPIYEYKCQSCEHVFEKLVFSSDKGKIECPKCKKNDTKKLLSSVSVGSSTSGGSAGSSGCGPGAPGGFS